MYKLTRQFLENILLLLNFESYKQAVYKNREWKASFCYFKTKRNSNALAGVSTHEKGLINLGS